MNYNYTPSCLTLYVWDDLGTGSSPYTTKYKVSGSSSFAFKQGAIPASVATAAKSQWALQPNPATNTLNITGNDTLGGTYRIIDMAGREVQSGILSAGAGKTDVTGLPAATYLVKITGSDHVIGNLKLVKE